MTNPNSKNTGEFRTKEDILDSLLSEIDTLLNKEFKNVSQEETPLFVQEIRKVITRWKGTVKNLQADKPSAGKMPKLRP